MAIIVDLPMSDSTEECGNDMENCILAVEGILNYQFRNRKLLEQALTHSSCSSSPTYERLEFVGDAALGLAFSNFFYLAYPNVDQGILSLLRAANISNEKLARVAIRHGLHCYVRHNVVALDLKVREFIHAVQKEDETAIYGGAVKAPKVLADIVESIVAAVYVDCELDLKFLWQVIRSLLEPIVTLDTLPLQPVTMLFELCQKQGKKVDIKYWKKDGINICSIYVDGKLIATETSDQKGIAKLNAAKEAIANLNQSAVRHIGVYCEMNEFGEIETAKQKLCEICSRKKWPKPKYRVVTVEGPAHEKKFICSVDVETPYGILSKVGQQRTRVKNANNSAASAMILDLAKSNCI